MESQEARGAWLQHRRSGGEQNWNHFQADDKPGSVFAQLQPECDGRDEVVRELEHGETQAGQVVENHLLQSRTCCRLTAIASLTTQQTVQHRVFFIIDYFLPNKSIYFPT